MPLNTQKLFDFLKIASQLENIERFKNHVFWKDYGPYPRYQSVADHSWRMALILIVLEKELSQPLDIAKALKMAILHDMPEIIIGDWSPLGSDGTGRDSHIYNKEVAKNKHELEKEAFKKIFSGLSKEFREELFEIWMEFEEQKSFEAKVVKAIDKFDGKLKAAEYQGGKMIDKHLDFSLKYGLEHFQFDPVFQELSDAVNEELKGKNR